MPSADLDKARSRFIEAVKRILRGLTLERDRIMEASESAPRLLARTEYEVRDLTNVPGNDLDYYAYELGRLQDAAREVLKVFDAPTEIFVALAAFEAAVPNLRAARNPLTHASDDARLDHVGWFSALVRLLPNGRVEYLVDPRYQHHETAKALAEALLAFLRRGLRQASP
jgi:hypothetical protein